MPQQDATRTIIFECLTVRERHPDRSEGTLFCCSLLFFFSQHCQSKKTLTMYPAFPAFASVKHRKASVTCEYK